MEKDRATKPETFVNTKEALEIIKRKSIKSLKKFMQQHDLKFYNFNNPGKFGPGEHVLFDRNEIIEAVKSSAHKLPTL